MKKVIRFVLISITFAIIFNSLAIADAIVNIPVPYTDTTVQARIIGSELVGIEISSYNNKYVVFGGTLLSNPTNRYNSHSYAWYSQNVETNQYWIDDPTNYYDSIKYEEVTTPQVGDIICYFDDRGTTSSSDDVNIHSGIIVEVLQGASDGSMGGTDKLMVVSKWSYAGLYRHIGYRCPYTPFINQVVELFGDDYATSEENIADYVKFYRAHELQETSCTISGRRYSCENCSYTVLVQHLLTYSYTSGNLVDHTATCRKCGYTCSQAHQWRDMGGSYRCLGCRMTTTAVPVRPNQLSGEQLRMMKLRLSMGQTTLSIDANTVLCYLDGQYYLVKATSETAALQVVNGLQHEIS